MKTENGTRHDCFLINNRALKESLFWTSCIARLTFSELGVRSNLINNISLLVVHWSREVLFYFWSHFIQELSFKDRRKRSTIYAGTFLFLYFMPSYPTDNNSHSHTVEVESGLTNEVKWWGSRRRQRVIQRLLTWFHQSSSQFLRWSQSKNRNDGGRPWNITCSVVRIKSKSLVFVIILRETGRRTRNLKILMIICSNTFGRMTCPYTRSIFVHELWKKVWTSLHTMLWHQPTSFTISNINAPLPHAGWQRCPSWATDSCVLYFTSLPSKIFRDQT